MLLLGVLLTATLTLALPRVALEPGQTLQVPEGWVRLPADAIPADARTTLVFALATPPAVAAAVEATLLAVSDPRSPQYGQHLPLAAADALAARDPAATAAVRAFLQPQQQHCEWLAGGRFVSCELPVAAAAQLLDTPFAAYVHPHHVGAPVFRALDRHYTVPAEVAPHLAFVGNVHRLHSPVKQRKEAGAARLPEAVLGVTPDVLRARYNLTAADVGQLDGSVNAQCIAQFLNQYYNAEDLTEFWNLFGAKFAHRAVVDKVVGPDLKIAGTEASLDTEYIMSTGANISTWFWSTGGKDQGQEPFLVWILGVANTSYVPWVHSVSYGDVESSLDPSFMQSINTEFGLMGTRGLSILFASGDDGAGCDPTSQARFSPNFPATSPFVTAVGGTFLVSGGRGGEEANSISSGGFSDIFPQPSYQTAAVNAFFASSTHLPKPSYFNRTGRAYPDVAAASANFVVVCNRVPMPGVAGTSCAAPTFSGIVALLNDNRLAAGKAPLGFLNPFLYQHGGLLYDVTTGCSQGCRDGGYCAQAGWDPVTGLGSPNYPALKAGTAF